MTDIIRNAKHWLQGSSRKQGRPRKAMSTPKDITVPARKLKAPAIEGGKTGQRSRLSATVRGIRAK